MTDATPRPPDLRHARQQVQAIVAGSPMGRQAPSAQAQSPLTFLDPVVEAKLAKRAAAGLTSGPTQFPRRVVLLRTVLPSAALAILDAGFLVAALVAGRTLLIVVAAVLLVALAAFAIGGWQYVSGDPLRLTARELRAVAGSRSWRSRRDWTGELAGSDERGIVIAAADAATRICRTPFWRAGRINDVQAHLDLGRELDAVDAEAHRIGTSGRVTANGPAWDALLDRVAALTAYANQVDGYEQRRAAVAAHNQKLADAPPIPDGTDEDEVVALLVYLNAVLPG